MIPTPNHRLAVLVAVAAISCQSSPSPDVPTDDAPHPYSEEGIRAGYPAHLAPGTRAILTLEPSPAARGEPGVAASPGIESVTLRIWKPGSVRLCFRAGSPHGATLRNAAGTTVASVAAAPDQACASDAPSLEAGDLTLELRHAGTSAASETLLLSFARNAVPAGGAPRDPSASLDVSLAPIEPYDPLATYRHPPADSARGFVRVGAAVYQLMWWANPGDCPDETVSPACRVNVGQWKRFDPSVRKEAGYYEYEWLQATSADPPSCGPGDLGIEAVVAWVEESIASGEIGRASPGDGFSMADREALYRETMVPCTPPDLSLLPDAELPVNVRTVKSVLSLATWGAFASRIATADGTNPRQGDFADVRLAYWRFLSAVARYPYFCGETGGRAGAGAFASLEEACRRDLAAFFAHAAQETGGGDPFASFQFLREGGAMDDHRYQPGGQCLEPFDCTSGWSLYYGRGPKQLTHFYNYAGFSASRFRADANGNPGFNFLLAWPDLVAWDPELYFLSGIWFVMTNQPPKPSMHDVIVHRYAPRPSCTETTCAGLAFDPVTGVAHPFMATIELINGGLECRTGKDNVAPRNRTKAYSLSLAELGATLSAEESAMPDGCAPIIANAGAGGDSIFGHADLQPGLRTWIDLAGAECIASSRGGRATVSVTAPGIVDACLGQRR